MDSNHDIASLPPLRAEFAGGTFRGITTRKDGTHCAVILLPNKATEQRNWEGCVDWAREAGGELPTRTVFHLLRLSATKEELAEGGWYYTADLLSDDTGDEDDAAYACSCFLSSGYTSSNRKSYEGLAVAVRLIPLTSSTKVGWDGREAFESAMRAKGKSVARAAEEYGGKYRFVEPQWEGWQARAAPSSPVEVGGDERESSWRFEDREGGGVVIHPPGGSPWVAYEGSNSLQIVQIARAALSADGGEPHREAKVGPLIYEACGSLPEGWRVRIEFENGYGGVVLVDPYDEERDMRADRDAPTIAEQLREAIDAAIATKAKGDAS